MYNFLDIILVRGDCIKLCNKNKLYVCQAAYVCWFSEMAVGKKLLCKFTLLCTQTTLNTITNPRGLKEPADGVLNV